jgi:hypothetical protein
MSTKKGLEVIWSIWFVWFIRFVPFFEFLEKTFSLCSKPSEVTLLGGVRSREFISSQSSLGTMVMRCCSPAV